MMNKPELKEGELYVGIILGKNGDPDYHLILLPGDESKTWKTAGTWAKKLGGELPTRREQSLLFANLKEEFKADWYWSGETYESDASYAWFQYFLNGGQNVGRKSNKLRCRAVRREEVK